MMPQDALTLLRKMLGMMNNCAGQCGTSLAVLCYLVMSWAMLVHFGRLQARSGPLQTTIHPSVDMFVGMVIGAMIDMMAVMRLTW